MVKFYTATGAIFNNPSIRSSGELRGRRQSTVYVAAGSKRAAVAAAATVGVLLTMSELRVETGPNGKRLASSGLLDEGRVFASPLTGEVIEVLADGTSRTVGAFAGTGSKRRFETR